MLPDGLAVACPVADPPLADPPLTVGGAVAVPCLLDDATEVAVVSIAPVGWAAVAMGPVMGIWVNRISSGPRAVVIGPSSE